MEIDPRFPTIQAGQPHDARDGETQAPPPAVLAGSGANTEFFISPVLRFDSQSLTVIFQVRDSGSGDVVRQFPPEAVVERYRQDPATRPFVLSPRTAADQAGDEDADAEDAVRLAQFPEAERPVEPALSSRPAATDQTAEPRPVDVVT